MLCMIPESSLFDDAALVPCRVVVALILQRTRNPIDDGLESSMMVLLLLLLLLLSLCLKDLLL